MGTARTGSWTTTRTEHLRARFRWSGGSPHDDTMTGSDNDAGARSPCTATDTRASVPNTTYMKEHDPHGLARPRCLLGGRPGAVLPHREHRTGHPADRG